MVVGWGTDFRVSCSVLVSDTTFYTLRSRRAECRFCCIQFCWTVKRHTYTYTLYTLTHTHTLTMESAFFCVELWFSQYALFLDELEMFVLLVECTTPCYCVIPGHTHQYTHTHTHVPSLGGAGRACKIPECQKLSLLACAQRSKERDERIFVWIQLTNNANVTHTRTCVWVWICVHENICLKTWILNTIEREYTADE